MSSDCKLLERLHRQGKITLTPCKNLPGKCTTSYDDRFIFEIAAQFDAVIISNDNYRDIILEDSNWRKIVETRVVGYTFFNDLLILPKDPYGRYGPKLEDILYKL